jgi:carbamoyl-phosphate synthase large subunit
MSVKEAVMPFNRFRTKTGRWSTPARPGDASTGEVMGIDTDFGTAFAKSQLAAYGGLPTSGTVFVSVANRDKRAMIFPVRALAELGFTLRRHLGDRRCVAPQRNQRRGIPRRRLSPRRRARARPGALQ